mmetsp:Transcript_77207/g.208438  ORF Transcript_77207/g.208438 Transcript_77207/m.208438 type:complete len:159 (+) Transcript_77207:800-1276(+)
MDLAHLLNPDSCSSHSKSLVSEPTSRAVPKTTTEVKKPVPTQPLAPSHNVGLLAGHSAEPCIPGVWPPVYNAAALQDILNAHLALNMLARMQQSPPAMMPMMAPAMPAAYDTASLKYLYAMYGAEGLVAMSRTSSGGSDQGFGGGISLSPGSRSAFLF